MRRDMLAGLRWHVRALRSEPVLERVRERIQLREERALLHVARAGRDVCWVDEGVDEPLVTVRVATRNRPGTLVERAVASALRQTYPRLEVLVVGDACEDSTAEALAKVGDDRVRYVNLLHRRPLSAPSPQQTWMVAPSHPMNVAAALARGAWIAPCDDDDELTDDHVEVLLTAARRHRYEMVHSNTAVAGPDGWRVIGAPELTYGEVSSGSVMFSAGLSFMDNSTTCWKLPQCHDWNLWSRMRAIGVVIGHVDAVTYRYFDSERPPGVWTLP